MQFYPASRTNRFTESVIREMTRLCHHYQGDRGINLAQGFPDFPAPAALKSAACTAINDDINQYSITWGAADFRNAIAAKLGRFYALEVDPETEITVCCGATEAMVSTLMATANPGDEVIVFAPYYENYWPDAVLAGATPRFVDLNGPDWSIDLDALRNAFNERTRAVIISSPSNPTGKVFTRSELETIANLCIEHDALAVTDEIYEHLIYEGTHIPMMTVPGMRERTVLISSLSKSYSVTGWRVGYAVAQPEMTAAIRKVHDFLTVGAPAPLQAAGVAAMNLPDEYYETLLADYRERRDFLIPILQEIGFGCESPDGAYYVMTNFREFDFKDDYEFAQYMVKEIGVAVVPGGSFYHRPEAGRDQVRFSFCKKMSTLERAAELLGKLGRRR